MIRLKMLKTIHVGPLRRELKEGDILDWDEETKYMSINSVKVEPQKGIDLKEAVDMLKRQREQSGEFLEPWTQELPLMLDTRGLPLPVSSTQVVLPILGCLKAAEDFIGVSREKPAKWVVQNESQYDFLKRFDQFKDLTTTLGDILRRKADPDVKVINAWLKENGFDIELNAAPAGSFAVASILDILLNWTAKGSEVRLHTLKGDFPAVKMSGDDTGITQFCDYNIHPYPIVCVRAESGGKLIKVYMSVVDYVDKGIFGITDKVSKLRNITCDNSGFQKVDGLTFPMVDYNQNTDISWMEGMACGDWSIGQAVQQTKFRMNEKGARAQSAVAMSFRCMCLPKPQNWVVIDRPFVLWIERESIPIPLFAGVFCEDVWRKPKDIESV